MRDKLIQRAKHIEQIRAFFLARNVLPVETPLLAHAGVTDPHCLQWQASPYEKPELSQQTYFLQTSPEYAMKRYLAKGSGDIYQLCKAFRHDPHSSWHHHEFTMLEWYRIGFDIMQLMDEITHLINYLAKTPFTPKKMTYQALFQTYANIDPLNTSPSACLNELKKKNIQLHKANTLTLNELLDALFTHVIEPALRSIPLLFIYHFPADQAALAKIHAPDPRVSERFECCLYGIECANGFDELNNASEQRKRFMAQNRLRQQQGLKQVPLDEKLLDLLDDLPDCAGVAIGVDRLIACLNQQTGIHPIE
jgi:elongation factor P--(R)-beta-lysine ligase